MCKKLLFGLILVCLIFSSCEQDPAHVHEYDNGVITEKPTCESIGVKVYTCSCGAEKTEVLAKLGHDPGELQSTSSTCTKEGSDTITCTRCGKILTNNVKEKLAHKWNDGEVIDEPTCFSIGSKKFTCKNCGTEKTETIPKLEHVESEEKTRDATCTQKGGTYTECTVCGEILSDGDIPALGHDWGDGVVINEATCTSIGSKKYTCSRCSEEKVEVINKLAHVESEQKTRAATCTEKGEVYTECETCGKYMNLISDIPALNHNWNDGVVVEEATCHSIGSKKFTCSRCGAEKLETTNKLDHVPATTSTLATCTVNGKEETKCTLCGEVLNTTVLKAQGHTWVFKERTLEPTCEVAGSDVYKCSVCSEEETRSVDALGHSFTGEVEEIAATCTKAGSRYGHCARCDRAVYTEIPKIDHTENAGVVTTQPTCTEKGEKTYSCSVCNTFLRKEEVAALGHSEGSVTITKTASCTETGTSIVRCTRCNEILETTVIPKVAHDLEKVSTKTVATCLATGVDSYKCKNCDYTEDETTDKDTTNHVGTKEYRVTTDATYFTAGTQTEYCSCGSATGNTKSFLRALTGFWEGTAATSNGDAIVTLSFNNGQLTMGMGMSGYYIEGAAYAYTVSATGITYTAEENRPSTFTKVSENASNSGIVGDKISLIVPADMLGVDTTVEFTRKTVTAHTHTYAATWEAIEIKDGNTIVGVGHSKKMLCTEHTAFDLSASHDYSSGDTCSVCGADKYYSIMQDGSGATTTLCMIKKGNSYTLPELPSGYATWSYQGSAYDAGATITPTTDILLTTNESANMQGYTNVVAYTHKCATHGIGYEPSSTYNNQCPICYSAGGATTNTYEVGNTVSLGTVNNQAITWRVLDVDTIDKKALVISENILENYVWGDQYGTYASSDIQSYLYDTSSDGFISKYGLSNVNILSIDCNGENTNMSPGGSEKVFLLSKTEFNVYSISIPNVTGNWWLRSYDTDGSGYPMYVDSARDLKGDQSSTTSLGLRPAMWVSTQ